MIAHDVPGLYYFFLGEERGGIGSGKVANSFDKIDYLKGINKVVSFDRRNYYSVITSQASQQCCSNDFAESLCEELNKSGLKLGLDPTGVFTDSANFIEYVPECTNISVGYFNEHTLREVQNIDYLVILARACVAANWNNLKVTKRIDDEVSGKWAPLIKDVKDMSYYNEVSIRGNRGKLVISIDFNDPEFSSAYDDIQALDMIMKMYGCFPDITFDGTTMKIEIL